MREAERHCMRARLEEFSRRLEARAREFQDQGEPSDVHQALMSQIQRRRDRLQARLASVEAKGSAWDVIRVEWERDFSSIHDDLLQLDERLDAGQMQQARR